jgi:hypothetical protein
MSKYIVNAYVQIDDEVIEADSEEEAQDIAWEIAERALSVTVREAKEDA